jgi:glycosyltransferase involved in cell wall biosynthesis
VRVYCRQGGEGGNSYVGVSLAHLPTIRHKYLDTIVHTFVSTLHLLFHRMDVALYCNGANAIFTPAPRLLGIPVALNVDGLERNRKKWNKLAKSWYLLSEWLTTFCPTIVITDAQQIKQYYQERYNKQSVFISYGAELGKVRTTEALQKLGLEPGKYFLYVSRMEPENNALLVREAFEKTDIDMKLVLVGDAPYASEYIGKVRDTNDPRVIIPGAIYGQGYKELESHCFAYIHATEVGGTHPALIEAMGRGALVLYLDTPENREVAGSAAIAFQSDLKQKLETVTAMSEVEAESWRAKALQRVSERYSWEAVTDAYEDLFASLLKK